MTRPQQPFLPATLPHCSFLENSAELHRVISLLGRLISMPHPFIKPGPRGVTHCLSTLGREARSEQTQGGG